jgi:radical SAM superfamily enzyme YgiQ (UPF0313 family)
LRADSISASLALEARRPRETSLTIAIEAGNEQLRQAVKKNVRDADVLATMEHLMAAGWHKFKLYFMCGFHAEPLEAMDDIAALVQRIAGLAKCGESRAPRLHLSLAVLVPKPHTPLQWQALERLEVTQEKQRRLRQQLRRFGGLFKLSWHDPLRSVVEALLARGGRELAPVIEQAYEAGQHLLDDNFNYEAWLAALAGCGASLDEQVYRERGESEALPWMHMDSGVEQRYLRREYEAYLRGESGPPCHVECTQCGIGCGGAILRGG